MNSKKIILPLIAAILLSIGVISFVSAQEENESSYLYKLYQLLIPGENSLVSQGEIMVSGDISIEKERGENDSYPLEIGSLSAKMTDGDDETENGAIRFAADETDGSMSIFLSEDGKPVEKALFDGRGLSLFNSELVMAGDPNKSSEISKITTLAVKVENNNLEASILNNTSATVTAVSEIASKITENDAGEIRISTRSPGKDGLTEKMIISEEVVRVNGKLTTEELCLASGCVEEVPENIWEETGSQNYTTSNNIEVEGTLKASRVEADYVALPKNFINAFEYVTDGDQRMTPISQSICFLTQMATGKGDHNRKCTIESNEGFYRLYAREATCKAKCITNLLTGIEGCTAFGGTPRDVDGNQTRDNNNYVMCEFTGSECPQNWEPYRTRDDKIWVSGEGKTCKDRRYGCSADFGTAPGFNLQKVEIVTKNDNNDDWQVEPDLSRFGVRYPKREDYGCGLDDEENMCYPDIKSITCKQ